MAKVVFAYNIDKDVENYLNSVYGFKWLKHGRKNIERWVTRFTFPEQTRLIKDAKNKKGAEIKIRNILRDIVYANNFPFCLIEKALENAWCEREIKFLNLLENFYEKPIYFDKVTAYFTTLPICPYDRVGGWFMVSYRQALEEQIRTICHELMHFMFLHYYWKEVSEKLKDKKRVEVLKEALTVFLNTEFREVNSVPDWGYPQEKALRELLLKERKKTKSFTKLLDKSIKFLQKS